MGGTDTQSGLTASSGGHRISIPSQKIILLIPSCVLQGFDANSSQQLRSKWLFVYIMLIIWKALLLIILTQNLLTGKECRSAELNDLKWTCGMAMKSYPMRAGQRTFTWTNWTEASDDCSYHTPWAGTSLPDHVCDADKHRDAIWQKLPPSMHASVPLNPPLRVWECTAVCFGDTLGAQPRGLTSRCAGVWLCLCVCVCAHACVYMKETFEFI